jgi:hypothetical protein
MGIYIGTMASVPSSVQPLAAGCFTIPFAMVRQKMHVIKSAEAEVWKGTNVCLVPQSNWDCMAMLQQHARYKAENPQTSALVLVPEQARKECSPLLANMTCLGKHMLPCHVLKVSSLPSSVLHLSESAFSSSP